MRGTAGPGSASRDMDGLETSGRERRGKPGTGETLPGAGEGKLLRATDLLFLTGEDMTNAHRKNAGTTNTHPSNLSKETTNESKSIHCTMYHRMPLYPERL